MENTIITDHLRQRFLERKKENKKRYSHLRTCKGCNHCVSLAYELRRTIQGNRSTLDIEIRARLEESKEINYIRNDAGFMSYIYDKYGYESDHRFHHHEDIVFITIRCEERGRVAVTCFDAKDSVFRDFLNRPKYKKKD